MSGSYLEIINSNFSDGGNLQMYSQHSGLALSIIKSTIDIENCLFSYLHSRIGPAIFAHDSPESNQLNNVTVKNSKF